MNDVISCLLDLEKGEISYMKNGNNLGIAFRLRDNQKSQTFYPAVVMKNSEICFNFGSTPFKHQPPSGYVAIASANTIPDVTVAVNPVNSAQGNVSVRSLKPENNAPQAIIIEPSRELAEQTYNQIQKVILQIKDL